MTSHKPPAVLHMNFMMLDSNIEVVKPHESLCVLRPQDSQHQVPVVFLYVLMHANLLYACVYRIQ